ncbi:hypothetical protein QFC22_004816 [Naganishia vaughanmartiniae]|uniref:Uncharacterized protein n=1 Tax=Naganishia vaughanmartiniae TaxID=1424756 RepID=A0ACC2WYI5_9TREE|nr:hypothetical protein QFC22_004816 [Naganishia vaughanmartiniae]
MDESAFKIDQHQWMAASERTVNTDRTTAHRPLAHASPGYQHNHAVRRSVPPAFSPPGFFTDRALANRSARMMDVRIVAKVNQNYEPPAIPRSATQTSEEARLARDSSLGWSMFGEDDGVSFDGSVDTAKDGQMCNAASQRGNGNSNTSSDDQLQLLAKSDRTFRANMVNSCPADPVESSYRATNNGSLSIGRDGSEEAMLALSDMIDVEMNQLLFSSQALTTGQSTNPLPPSNSSTVSTTSSSIEYPRSGPRHHLSHDPTDSLSAYEYIQYESDNATHPTYSANQQATSESPISRIAASTPLTHFAASSSTNRTSDGIPPARPTERTALVSGIRSISRTMVAHSSTRGRHGDDSTPLTALEVSPAALTFRKPRSSDQQMHSTPLSDYAVVPPPKKGTSDSGPAPPVQTVAMQMEDDDVSVEYGRGGSVLPLQDDLQDLVSEQSMSSNSDSQDGYTSRNLHDGTACGDSQDGPASGDSQDGHVSSETQDGQSEDMATVSPKRLHEPVDIDTSLHNSEDGSVTEQDTPEKSLSPRLPSATSTVQSLRLDIENSRYSKRLSRGEVQGGSSRSRSTAGEVQLVSASS